MSSADSVVIAGSIAQAHRADEYVALGQLDACLGMIGKLKDKLVI